MTRRPRKLSVRPSRRLSSGNVRELFRVRQETDGLNPSLGHVDHRDREGALGIARDKSGVQSSRRRVPGGKYNRVLRKETLGHPPRFGEREPNRSSGIRFFMTPVCFLRILILPLSVLSTSNRK